VRSAIGLLSKAIPTNAILAAMLATSPSELWPLDDPSGSTARNLINAGRTGTYNGSPTLNQTGPGGLAAAEFNGSSQSVSLSNAFTTPLAHGIWFKSALAVDASNFRGTLFSDQGGGRALYLGPATGALSNEQITVSTNAGNSFRAMTQAGINIPGTWHFLGVSWTGSLWEISLDGVQVDNATSGTPTAWAATVGRIAVGPAGNADWFTGRLSHYAQWTSHKSVADFRSIWQAYLTYLIALDLDDLILSQDPLVYWKLAETSGSNADDASPNNRDGTYSGSPAFGTTFVDGSTGPTFDGSNDWANIADASWMDVGAQTVVVFANADALVNKAVVTRDATGVAANRPWVVVHSGSAAGKMDAYANNAAGPVKSTTSARAVEQRKWKGLAWKQGGGALAGIGAHYVDGGLDNRYTGGSALQTGAAPIRVGAVGDGTVPFAGGLRHFAFFGADLPGWLIAAITRKGLEATGQLADFDADDFWRPDSTTTMGKTRWRLQDWTPINGVWGISSGEAYHVSGTSGLDGFGRANCVDYGVADGEVSVRSNVTANSAGAGVAFRFVDSSNGWLALTYRSSGGAPLFYLIKYVAGVATNVVNGVSISTAVCNVTVRFHGKYIEPLVNGVSMGIYVDTTHQTATKHGIGLNAAGANANRVSEFMFAPYVTPTNSYDTEVLADTPWGYWKLDETSGSTAEDSSGNNRDGTYSGISLSSRSEFGVGGDWDGSSGDYVTCPSFTPGSPGVTLEAWCRIDSVQSGSPFIRSLFGCERESGSPTGIFMRFVSATIEATHGNGSSYATAVSLAGNLVPGLYHIAVTWAPSGQHRLYVNGVCVSQQTALAAITMPASPSFFIGNSADSHARGFDGTISKVAVYQAELTPARILAHFKAFT
jgi:hypothetical protein